MATLTTKLKADTTLHDAAINKSAKQIYSYKKNVDETKKVFSNLGQSLGKFAGVLGIATGALDVFKTGLDNVESLTDTWGRTTRITTSVISELFSNIQAGRFDNFISGLKDVILNAKDAYNALDNLSTFKAFTTPELAKNQAAQDKASYDIKGLKNGVLKTSDTEGKNLKYWQDYLKQKQDERIKLLDKLDAEYNDAIASLNKEIYGRFKNNKNYKTWMAKYTGSAEANKLAASDLEKYKDQLQELKSMELDAATSSDGLTLNPKLASDFRKSHKAQYDYLELIVDFLTNVTDKEKKITELNNVQTEKYLNQSAKYNSLAGNLRQLKNATGSIGTGADKKNQEEELSLLEQLEQQLKDLQKQKEKLYNGFDDNGEVIFDRLKLDDVNKKIEETTNKINKLKEALEPTTNTDFSVPGTTLVSDPDDYYKQIEGYQKTWDDFMSQINETLTTSSSTIYGNVKDISSSVNGLLGSFESLKDLFNDDDADFVDYFSTITSTVFSTIDAIASLVTAIKTISAVVDATNAAETVVQYAKAAAYTAEMASAVTAFYAPLGPAGIAPAAATIAAYKALAEAGKFASGGIVAGNTTVGDMSLARVNAGEMILNSTLQARLFKMLNGVATSHATNLDLSQVTFKLSGSDLYGSLSNYENKKSRIR